MASLGSLVVSLAMDTARFQGDIGKAAQQMQRLVQQAGKMGAAIGAAVGAGAAATLVMVKHSIDAADAATKQAQAVGLTVEKYTELTYAAGLSGVAHESLGQSLGKLAKGAADAARGSGEAMGAFDAMGISIKNTDGTLKNTDQLMGEVADKFSTYRDGAAKTALAQRLFGESGTKLIAMLNGGAKGLADMAAEANELGVVIATKTGKHAEELNDNLARLDAVKQGLVNRITAELLPSLQSLSTELIDSAKSSGALDQAARAAATGVRFLVAAAANVAYVFAGVGNEIGGILAQLAALSTGDFKAFSAIGEAMKEDAEAARKKIDAINAAIWDETSSSVQRKVEDLGGKLDAPLVKGAEKAAKAAKQIQDEAQRAYEAIQKQLGGMQFDVDTQGASDRIKGLIKLRQEGATGDQLSRYLQLADAQEQFQRATEAAAKAQQTQQSLFAEGASLAEQMRLPLEVLEGTQTRLNELLNAGAIDWQTYARAAAKAQDDFTLATKKAKEGTDRNAQAAKDLGLTFSSAFEDAAISGAKLSDVLKGLAQDVLRIMLRKSVTEPLAGGLTSFFGGMFGGGGGGTVSGGISPGGGYDIPLMATGTNWVPRDNFPALLHKGEAVVPAKYNPAAGGGGTSIVIENHGARITEQRSRGSDGREEVRLIVEAAVAEVDRRIGSGGSTAQALKGRGLNLSGGLPRRA